jgi:hypothetical protein
VTLIVSVVFSANIYAATTDATLTITHERAGTGSISNNGTATKTLISTGANSVLFSVSTNDPGADVVVTKTNMTSAGGDTLGITFTGGSNQQDNVTDSNNNGNGIGTRAIQVDFTVETAAYDKDQGTYTGSFEATLTYSI